MGEPTSAEDPSLSQTDLIKACPKDEMGSSSTNGEEKPERLTRNEIMCVIHLCVTNFSVGVFYGMLGPFFPQEAASKGMGPGMTGVAFSAYQFVVIVTSPIYGARLTRLGLKRTYICGLLLASTSSIAFGMLAYCPGGTSFKVLTIIIRMIQGLGSSAYITASFSIVGTLFPKRISSMMAYLEVSNGLGNMVGPPLGGILYQFGGFLAPFLAVGTANIFWAFVSVSILPSGALKSVSSRRNTSLMWLLLKMPVIDMIAFSLIAGFATITFLDVGFALRLKELFDFSPLVIGMVFLLGPAMYCIAAITWGYIADKKPHLNLAFSAVGFIMAGTSFMFFGPAPFLHLPEDQLWITAIALFFGASGLGTFVVCFQVMASTAVQSGMPETSETFGAVSGIIASATSIGSFIGPLLGGYLIENIKFPWASFVFACNMLAYGLLATLYLVVKSPCTKQSKHRVRSKYEMKQTSDKQRLLEESNH